MKKFILIIFLISSGIVYAQPYTLHGKVVDSLTNEPLFNPGFSYLAERESKNGYIVEHMSGEAQIDTNGYFYIEGQVPIIDLGVYHCGYIDRKLQLNLLKDSNIIVRMQPSEEAPEKYYFVQEQDTTYYDECSQTNGIQEDFILNNEYLSCYGLACNGLVSTYYRSGQLKEEAVYVNGKVYEGQYISFYKNGQIDEVGQYQDGQQSGQWVFYNENGLIEAIWNFNSNGGVEMSLNFGENGALEDYRLDRDDSSCLVYSADFHEDGRIRSSYYQASCSDSLMTYKKFYPNGILELSGYFVNGMPHGVFKYYNKDGILFKTEYIEDGELISTSTP